MGDFRNKSEDKKVDQAHGVIYDASSDLVIESFVGNCLELFTCNRQV